LDRSTNIFIIARKDYETQKMDTQIDHIAHGWALLAMRMPEIRALSRHRQTVGELCECYSIAVLHLRGLKNVGNDLERIDEYEELVAGIEQEVSYYLKSVARLSA
jgi:hypothetical protein